MSRLRDFGRIVAVPFLIGAGINAVAIVLFWPPRVSPAPAKPAPSVWHPAAPTPETRALEDGRRDASEVRLRIEAECESKGGMAVTQHIFENTVTCYMPTWKRTYPKP